MGKAKSVTGSDSGSKTGQASTVRKSSAQPRVSKRGANEDSEVRYDTKHVQKKQKNGKKNSKKAGKDDDKVDSLDSDAGTSDDTNSVVSGNEDDKGSVVSALLEEDICYQCGEGTMNGDEWGEVVMCDICDGEYHLKCQNLTCTPEGSFFCTKCKDDEEHFKDMRFEVSSSFKVFTYVIICCHVWLSYTYIVVLCQRYYYRSRSDLPPSAQLYILQRSLSTWHGRNAKRRV